MKGLIRFDSPLLNYYYTPTIFVINEILRRNEFIFFRDGIKYLPLTLIGNEELDLEWGKERSNAYIFFAKIESEWLKAGKLSFELPTDLQNVFNEIDKAIAEYDKQRKEFEKNLTKEQVKNKSLTSSMKTYSESATPEKEIKGLAIYSDGSIRYNGELLEMRDQIREICRLFIDRPNHLITFDDIKDEILELDKKEITSFSTISKYISELRKILKDCFHKDVFLNQKKEGWFFRP